MLNMAAKLTVKRGGSFRGSGVCGRRALPSAPLLPSYCLGFSAVQGLHNAADGARLRDFFNRIFFPRQCPPQGRKVPIGPFWKSVLNIAVEAELCVNVTRLCFGICTLLSILFFF